MAKFKKVRSRELAVKAAKNYLTKNPSLSGGNLYILPDGTKLLVRKKENGRLSAENYNTKANSDKLRSQRATPKGDEEASYVRSKKLTARQNSDDLIHQIAANGRPSIAEHNVRLASGGDNEKMSISEPDYKDLKDSVESKVSSKYGDQFIVDVDDVTGGARAIPEAYYNKYELPSKQKGFTFEQGESIDLNKLEKFAKNGNGNGNGAVNGYNGNGASNGVDDLVSAAASMKNGTKLVVDEASNVLKVANKIDFGTASKLLKGFF